MTLELTVGDTAPTLTGNVSANLTGATALVHIRRPDRTVISRAPSIAVGTVGAWSLRLVAGDLTGPGIHRVEVEVTFSDGSVQTFAEGTDGAAASFNVRQQIA